MESHGTHFVHASDEWYLLAEEELPDEDNYDGYIQLENGVGMIRLLLNEFAEALLKLKERMEGEGKVSGIPDRNCPHIVSLATGRLMAPFIKRMADDVESILPNYTFHVYAIRNDFFGERITVSGLLTGQDIVAQLKDQPLGERLLLPCNLLRSGEEVLLDDMTLTQLKTALQVEIDIVKSSGQDLLDTMLGMKERTGR